MVARFTGGMLGLLAFGVATLAGLSAGNSANVVLSRALWSLFVFCGIGLVVGAAAQAVINEYMARKESELFPETAGVDDPAPEQGAAQPPAEPAVGE